MNRREFMQLAAVLTTAGALPLKLAYAGKDTAIKMSENIVALTGVQKEAGTEVLEDAVRMAAESATDFSWLSKGDAVLIKPVLNSGHPYPATTSPLGIAAVVRLLKRKGAGRIIVSDMSGVEHVKFAPGSLKGSSRELMIKSGMAQAVQAAGAEVHFPEEQGWKSFFEDGPTSGSNWKAGIMMPNILKDVDHLILMPRCGRHVLAGSSLGMKAAVGYWRQDSRLEYHRDASTFHEKTAESNTVSSLIKKQRLVLTTATKVLTTFGPDRGYAMEPDVGLIIASESILAHDMVSLAWLLENRRLTPGSRKIKIRDPYKSQFVVSFGNKQVVKMLGGGEESKRTEKLIRNDLLTIWDDKVLRRGFEVLGGLPLLKLVNANEQVPGDLIKTLSEMTTPLE